MRTFQRADPWTRIHWAALMAASLATQRSKLGPVVAVFATAGFLIAFLLTALTPLGYLLAIPIVLMAHVVSVIRLGRKQRQLLCLHLEIEGNRLRQLERSSGALVAEIDLQQPYTYEFLSRQSGFAIYQLRQGDSLLAFTSKEPVAEEVVTSHLGIEWPPTAGRSFTA